MRNFCKNLFGFGGFKGWPPNSRLIYRSFSYKIAGLE
jgi:hypothetical protein